MKTALRFKRLLCTSLLMLPLLARADMKVLIGTDPADEAGKQSIAIIMSSMPALSASLGSKLASTQTSNLTDAIRATRTSENDVIIGPPHIIASAISHQYQVLARSDLDDEYVLIARPEIKRLDDMAGKRLYLTQQDSTRTYLAKGMLIENNFDIKTIKQVTYGKTSGAGLFAIANNMTDMTIASRQEAMSWLTANPDKGNILKTSRKLPAGLALAVRNDTAENARKNLLKWLNSSELRGIGEGKFRSITSTDVADYHYIASLGILTPSTLAGVKVVTAENVMGLLAKSTTIVDTRSEKEYQFAHIKGAINAPYVEHSLKDRDFDAKLDDYSAIAALPKNKPLVFLCNGPECWKSYKASIIGQRLGFKEIYWFRGGMPEWKEKSLPTANGG